MFLLYFAVEKLDRKNSLILHNWSLHLVYTIHNTVISETLPKTHLFSFPTKQALKTCLSFKWYYYPFHPLRYPKMSPIFHFIWFFRHFRYNIGESRVLCISPIFVCTVRHLKLCDKMMTFRVKLLFLIIQWTTITPKNKFSAVLECLWRVSFRNAEI